MKIFALIDCNNFYASCERVFNPALQNKPIVILSNNDGCIIARSNEAKQLNIPMGAPFFEYAKLIKQHKVHVFSSNYALYGDMSERVMSLLEQFSPDLEIYSIDEAFLRFDQLSDSDYAARALAMRDFIFKATGLPTSVGIGSTKTLAKVANHYAKKNHLTVFELAQNNTDEILKQMAVEDIWGIAWRTGHKLRKLNIKTAFELKYTSPLYIRKLFGIVLAKTVYELNNIACLDLQPPEAKKNIMSSRSFATRLTSLVDLSAAIASFCAQAGTKLRAQQSLACGISIFLRTGKHDYNEPFYSNCLSMPLINPTDDTGYLIQTAQQCLQKIYRPGYRYQKAGVLLLDLIDKDHQQLSLLPSLPNRDNLMAVIDKINQRMGDKTIYFAQEYSRKILSSKRAYKSPSYTTNWQELPKAIA